MYHGWDGCECCLAADPYLTLKSCDADSSQDYLAKPVKGKLLEKVSSLNPHSGSVGALTLEDACQVGDRGPAKNGQG